MNRYEAARDSATNDGYQPAFDEFCRHSSRSVAVYNCGLSEMLRLSLQDNNLISTFLQKLEADVTSSLDDPYDLIRPAIDGALFPNYAKEVRFAALSLDGMGLDGYGYFTAEFREVAIQDRATVFECNSVDFFIARSIRPDLTSRAPVPLGHRAVWHDRHFLAGAKLGTKTQGLTIFEDFAKLLLRNGATKKDDDFVEVHIYGPCNRRSFQAVRGRKPRRKADLCLFNSSVQQLKAAGIAVEVA